MMPTLNPAGDVVLVEHVTTTLGRLERGHVIVAKSPTDPNAVVCKRILGLPGDTVRLPSLTHNASSAGLFSCEHDHPPHTPTFRPSAIRHPRSDTQPHRVSLTHSIVWRWRALLCSAHPLRSLAILAIRTSEERTRTLSCRQGKSGCKGTTCAIQQTRGTTVLCPCRSSQAESSSRYAHRMLCSASSSSSSFPLPASRRLVAQMHVVR